MTAKRPRASAAAATAACLALGAHAGDLRLDSDFASAREAFDPVRWILAQAGGASAPVTPDAPAEAAAARPTWAARVFPFLDSGEPVGFAPARWGGTAGLEYLAHRSENLRRRDQLIGSVNLNAASYFWKPWFAQVTGNLTVLAAGERGGEAAAARPAGFASSTSLSGGGTVTVFPASRFPFVASVQSTDSRASGEFASTDRRNTRASLRQTYRDPLGTATYIGTFDYSAIASDAFGRDTVAQLDARYLGTRDPHRTDAVMTWSRNRQDAGAGSDLLRAYASHLYTPTPELWVSSLANFSESQFSSAGGGADFTQRVGQLSSQAVWRPEFDDRLVVTGGGRIFTNQFLRGGEGSPATSLSGNLGASFALTEEATLNAAVTATRADASGAGTDLITFESVGATYTSRPIRLGFADYSLGATAQGAHQGGGTEESRTTGSVQADQQVSRTVELGKAVSLNLLATQGGGVIEDSRLGRTDQLRAGVSAGMRVVTAESAEAYFGASYSGSRSRGGLDDRFRLGNVQANGLLRFGAYDALSANVTAQWVRGNRAGLEAEERTRQVFGGITYQHSRLFGVPRLRYRLSANFNEGVVLDSRLLGDVDATGENVTHLVDSQLSYDIGRLEIRVGTRLAKVNGRDDLQWYLRIHRHFGQY